MNKKLFMHPVRFMAVLATAAMFTGCAKDKFTEADALDLELKRLRTEDSIRVARERQQRIEQINLLRYQRSLDSLDRINAGGRVFYSLTVVAGGNANFGSGRTEGAEGVQGATVSVAQYGQVQTVTTGASGIATFELRSGMANVVASAPGHTTVDYVVNLTPDGSTGAAAPGNGATVYVGNVLPLFPNAAGSPGVATIRGNAYIETNLTNDREEFLVSIPANDRPATLGAVSIEINQTFRQRYLTNGNQASNLGPASGNGFEGDIVRIAYEASTIATSALAADGSYSITGIPATGTGVPVRLDYSEVATNRTYFRVGPNGEERIVTDRYIYGPNVTPSGVALGVGKPRLSFQAFTTAATATATYVAGETLQSVGSITVSGNQAVDGTNVLTTTGAPQNRGAYLVAPSVVITGTGTGATGTANLVAFRNPEASNFIADDLREVGSVTVNAGGSGYTANPTVAFDRINRDVVRIGTGTIQGTTAGGGIATFIRITDGGFGFIPTTLTEVIRPGNYTNFLPRVVFNQAPNTPFAPGVITQQAIAQVELDQANASSGIGTASQIVVINAGEGYPTTPVVDFIYGDALSIPGRDAATENLFVSNGSGGLRFNTVYVLPGAAALTNTRITFNASGILRTAKYSLVPTADLLPNDAATQAAPLPGGPLLTNPGRRMSFTVAVDSDPLSADLGTINFIEIADQGLGIHSVAGPDGTDVFTDPTQSVGIQVRPDNTERIRAVAFLAAAGSLNNYTLSNNTPAITGFGTTLTNPADMGTRPLTTAAEIRDAVIESDWLAAFVPPTTTGIGAAAAWGIPVITNSGRIEGVRMISGGVGYTGAVDMYLVPNAFRTSDRYDGAGEFSNVGFVDAITQKEIPQNILELFVDASTLASRNTFVNARATAARATRSAYVEFVMTNTGAGYTVPPTVRLTGGGLTLTDLNALIAPGVTMFNGTVSRIGNATSVVTGNNLPAGTGHLAIAPTAAQAAALAASPLSLFIIDERSQALTTAFRTAQDIPVAGNNGPLVEIRINPTTGAISGIFDGPTVAASVATPSQSMVLDKLVADVSWPALGFNQIPRVTIAGGNVGTGATFEIPAATADPQTSGVRLVGTGLYKIQRINVTNGGTGYSRGNAYQREFTELGAGQAFAVIGGSPLNNSESTTRFSTYSNITYIRDVHYGTGRLLD